MKDLVDDGQEQPKDLGNNVSQNVNNEDNDEHNKL